MVEELPHSRESLGESLARRDQGRRPGPCIGGAGVWFQVAVEPGDSLTGSYSYVGRAEGESLDHHEGGAGNVSSDRDAAHPFNRGGRRALREAATQRGAR